MALRLRLVLATVLAFAATATALTPAAHADTYRTATSTGHGPTRSAGQANAEANARAELNRQAAAANEVCPSVSVSSTHVYTAPDGSAYIYQATASGTCVTKPPPEPSPYTVPRTATSQAGGATSHAAIQAGSQAATATVLAAGVACTGWTTTTALVWAAPGSVWYIYNVTVSAMCTH